MTDTVQTTAPPVDPPAHKPLDAASMIAMTKPISRSLPVCLDGSLRAAYDRAQNATKHAEQALVQAERALDLTRPRKRDRGGIATIHAEDDTPLGGIEPEPDDAPIVSAERIKALRRMVAELTLAEEEARAALLRATYEITVRSFPGGETARQAFVISHCTGDPLIKFNEDSEPVRQKDPSGSQFKGFKVQHTQDGQIAREIGSMPQFRAEMISRCLIDPKMDVGQVTEWLEALNSDSTADLILQLVQIATTELARVPFSRATTTPE